MHHDQSKARVAPHHSRAGCRPEPGIQIPAPKLDSGFGAEPVIGPAGGRTRWHRPGMTARRAGAAVAGVSHVAVIKAQVIRLYCGLMNGLLVDTIGMAGAVLTT